jgi:iron complex outermembrane receptor protein
MFARTLLAAAVTGALPLLALADEPVQAPDQSAEQDTGARTGQRLETVIVTAQRRAENLKDVPMSVTAIKGEKLEVLTSGGADIRFLAGRSPSLNVESDYGRSFPRFYIRGQGNTDFDLNASQPVGLVVDDIVQESPMLKGFPVFDVDQVEVLRGPQGTLFGRNSPAGVIKFDSATPSTRKAHTTCRCRTRWRCACRCSPSTATTVCTTRCRTPTRATSKAMTTMPRACNCSSSRPATSRRCSMSTDAT